MPPPSEDQVVLFVDMLGFASLVESTPNALAKLEPIFQPLTTLEAVRLSNKLGNKGPLVEQFTRFHIALEKRIRDKVNKGITAITFSDSAFIHLPQPEAAIIFARSLMRELVKNREPTRMGIGYGSFAALRFFSDSTPAARIHTTQFLGTAVVRAHAAEQSGIKGLRILIHPSAMNVLRDEDPASWLSLDEGNDDACAEVNYLFFSGGGPTKTGPAAIRNRHDVYRDYVDSMRDKAPANKRHYYSNTIAAYVRMRDHMLKLRKKQLLTD